MIDELKSARFHVGKLKVGIIGCGAIGAEIARSCQSRIKNRVRLIGICDINEERARALSKTFKNKIPIFKLDALIKKSDMVVEAASAGISANILKRAISRKKDIMIMSVGGLLNKKKLLRKASKAGIKVYLPSGAISGIDGLKSAAVGRLNSVTLTTRKPPAGLEGAPYLEKNNIKISSIREETVVFEGNAAEAVRGFPQNVNVCAVLSLAGLGAANTRVRIITSPAYTKNTHEVEIKGESGRITAITENVPSMTNPKTSQLAIYSAIATLEGAADSVRIGT